MSSRGASRGRGEGSNNGRGSGGFGSRGRGGFQPTYGPPAAVLEMGSFVHACEGDIVCESINPKVPKFNAPIYLKNKTAIGKVDEILGPINQVYFTVKPQDGIVATSFKSGDKFYIGGDRLLPLEMFLPKPKPPPGTPKAKRAGGGSRGGLTRGGRGSRGSSRGAPRGRGGGGDRGRGGNRGGGGRGFGGRGGGFGSSRGGGGRGSNPNFTRARGAFRGRGS